jgi:hypothetical protein
MRGLLFVLLLAVGTCGVIAAAPRFKKAPPLKFKRGKHVVVEPVRKADKGHSGPRRVSGGGSAGQVGENID